MTVILTVSMGPTLGGLSEHSQRRTDPSRLDPDSGLSEFKVKSVHPPGCSYSMYKIPSGVSAVVMLLPLVMEDELVSHSFQMEGDVHFLSGSGSGQER